MELAILRAQVVLAETSGSINAGGKAAAGPLALRLARRLGEEGTSEALAEAAGLCEGLLDAAGRLQAEGGVDADEVRALLLEVQGKQGAAAAASPSVSLKSGTPRRETKKRKKRKAPEAKPSDLAEAVEDPMGSAIDSGKVQRNGASPGRRTTRAAPIEDIEMPEKLPLSLSRDVVARGASSWRGAGGSSAADEAPRPSPLVKVRKRPSSTTKDVADASLEASELRGGSLPMSINSEATVGRTDGTAAAAGHQRGGSSDKATTGHQQQPPKRPVNVRDLIAGLLDSDDEDDGAPVGMSATAGKTLLSTAAQPGPSNVPSRDHQRNRADNDCPSQGPPNPTASATQGGVAALLKDLYES